MINKKRLFLRGNFLFLLIVAFLCGAIIKRAMTNHFRIGFEDPQTVIHHGVLYDIDELEQEVIQNGLPEDRVIQ